MSIFTRLARSLLAIALLAGLFTVASGAAPAGADPNARTDDSSVAVPTASWVYTNVSTATVGNLLRTNNARLTDIEPYSTSGDTWTVTMVRNSGAYSVPGWWWYVDITASQISSFLTANNARLIDIEAYDDGGTLKYAVVMVANTGTTARGWTYLIGATTTSISSHIRTNNQRMIDIESYTVGGVTRYAAIFVTNSGTDAKSWEWWTGQTAAQVGQRVSTFGGRITDMDRGPDGTYAFIQVKNAGTDNFYWRYHFGLSISQVTTIMSQYGVRLVDIDMVVNGRTVAYDIVAIDSSTAESRRLNNIVAGALTASNGYPRAEWGFLLRPLNGNPQTALQATTPFEPASAIKAVHNLSVLRKVKSAQDSLSANNFIYYRYPSSGQTVGNECPDPAKETTANRQTSTVDAGRRLMMGNSDNRTTRGVTLRYGLPYIQQSASVAGMSATTIDQDRIGCGYVNAKRNQTTLADLAKLYDGVQSGSLLDAGPLRSAFFSGMNGDTFNSSSDLEIRVQNIITAEAQALGKSTAVATAVRNGARWYYKPGGYGINCDQPLTPCTSGYESIGTIAGVLSLPFKVNGNVVTRSYLWGTYIEGLNTACSGCPSYPTAAEEMLRAELLRPVIRAALRTY